MLEDVLFVCKNEKFEKNEIQDKITKIKDLCYTFNKEKFDQIK